METHVLEPAPGAVHGYFSRDLPAVLTVRSGDRIRFRIPDAGWGFEPHELAPPFERRRLERPDGHDGHALCGPVFVHGARPGDTLEVRLEAVEPGDYGWTFVGGWPSPVTERLGLAHAEAELLSWRLDPVRGTGTNQFGDQVELASFPGIVGLAPREPGPHSTVPPRRTGGNLDCKELVAGSSLFLPIEVEGALLSVGDGHAAQGDGEVCGQAIECPLARLELTVHLHQGQSPPLPRAETPAGSVTFGLGDTFDDAAGEAAEAMIELFCSRYDLDRKRAAGLASVAVDLRVTQLVNGTVGAHALLPLRKLGVGGQTEG